MADDRRYEGNNWKRVGGSGSDFLSLMGVQI